jgi:hypothetical protein
MGTVGVDCKYLKTEICINHLFPRAGLGERNVDRSCGICKIQQDHYELLGRRGCG